MKSQFILAVLPAVAFAAKQVDYPTGAAIRNVGYAGTGCSKGSASYSFDTDGALSVETPNFNASAGTDVPIRSQRSACSLLVEVTYPANWQFALKQAQVWGDVDLTTGATASQSGKVSFSGVEPTSTFASNFQGPYRQPYALTYQENDASKALWSTCALNGQADSTLIITTAANVGTDAGNGTISVDRSRFWIAWRQCSQ